MSKNVSNYIQITVPAWHIRSADASVKDRIDLVTGAAGGVTRTAAFGEWLDDAGNNVTEDVLLYRWYFAAEQAEDIRERVSAVIQRLHELGEVCVLRERFYSWREGQQFKAELIYK